MGVKGTVYGICSNDGILSSNFAAATAEEYLKNLQTKKKVLLIDSFGGSNQETSNAGIIKGKEITHLHKVLESSSPLENIVKELPVKTTYDNYDMILSDIKHTHRIDKSIVDRLRNTVKLLKEEYDSIILNINQNRNTNLPELIDIADYKFLVVEPETISMTAGLKIARDYVIHRIKENINSYFKVLPSHLISQIKETSVVDYNRKSELGYRKKNIEKDKNLPNELLKRNYNNIDDLCQTLKEEIRDVGLVEELIYGVQGSIVKSGGINGLMKEIEIGLIFNQLNEKTKIEEQKGNFLILGKKITNLYSDPNSIKVNNMNGFGGFSLDSKLVEKAEDEKKPIVCLEKGEGKNLYKELKAATNFFIGGKNKESGVLPDVYDREVIDKEFEKGIPKKLRAQLTEGKFVNPYFKTKKKTGHKIVIGGLVGLVGLGIGVGTYFLFNSDTVANLKNKLVEKIPSFSNVLHLKKQPKNDMSIQSRLELQKEKNKLEVDVAVLNRTKKELNDKLEGYETIIKSQEGRIDRWFDQNRLYSCVVTKGATPEDRLFIKLAHKYAGKPLAPETNKKEYYEGIKVLSILIKYVPQIRKHVTPILESDLNLLLYGVKDEHERFNYKIFICEQGEINNIVETQEQREVYTLTNEQLKKIEKGFIEKGLCKTVRQQSYTK